MVGLRAGESLKLLVTEQSFGCTTTGRSVKVSSSTHQHSPMRPSIAHLLLSWQTDEGILDGAADVVGSMDAVGSAEMEGAAVGL